MRLEKMNINKNRELSLRWSTWSAPHPKTGEREFVACFNDGSKKYSVIITETELDEILGRKNEKEEPMKTNADFFVSDYGAGVGQGLF